MTFNVIFVFLGNCLGVVTKIKYTQPCVLNYRAVHIISKAFLLKNVNFVFFGGVTKIKYTQLGVLSVHI
jgi:hypothetical protein